MLPVWFAHVWRRPYPCAMRFDCHMHTSPRSGCSVLHPDDLCEAALARGLDAVVLTEHHQRWPDDELARLAARHPGLRLFSGQEITVGEGFDIVVLGPASRVRVRPFTPLDEVQRALAPARDESFLISAHPFRYTTHTCPELEAIFDWVDAIEMNSVNILHSGCEREQTAHGTRYICTFGHLYEAARQRHGLIGLYNSDAHSRASVGAVATEVTGPDGLNGKLPPDEAALVATLRGLTNPAHVRERQLPELLTEQLAPYM